MDNLENNEVHGQVAEEHKEPQITMTQADFDKYMQSFADRVTKEIEEKYKPQLEGLTKKNGELFKQIESASNEKLTVEEEVKLIRQELEKEREDKRWIQAFSGLDSDIVNIVRNGTPEEIAGHYKGLAEEIKSKAIEQASEDFAKKYGRTPAKGGDLGVSEVDVERFKKEIGYAQSIKDKNPELYQKYRKLLRG